MLCPQCRRHHLVISPVPNQLFSQVIEDPVEIIDNARELKGFHNIEEDIKLVGFFKGQKSERTYPNGPCNGLFSHLNCLRSSPVVLCFFRLPGI